MNNNLIITDKAIARLRIGELIGTRTFDDYPHRSLISDKWAKLYALALRDTNPLWYDTAFAQRAGYFRDRVLPTAYYTIFNPMENGGACPASDFWEELSGEPGPHWGGHAAHNKVEAIRPLRLGDHVARSEMRNLGCFEKRGKQTILVCAETEYRVFDAKDNLMAICAYGNIRQFPYPAGKSA